MRMKDMCGRVKAGVCRFFSRLRENLVVLFVVAFVLGGVAKVGFSHFVTVGYNDYLTEKQGGFDFEQIRKDFEKRQEEEQKKQQGVPQDDSGSAMPSAEEVSGE